MGNESAIELVKGDRTPAFLGVILRQFSKLRFQIAIDNIKSANI
ncbi:hypothetical protein QT972_33960 [Microcoleus sp. herbarium7]